MHKLLIITLLLFTGCSKNKNLASDSFQNGLDAFEKKEYEKAISFFNDATELNPNEPKYITELVRLSAVLISNVIQDDNDQNFDFIFENFIQIVKFPLIQTDTHHNPQMWKNLPEDIKTKRDRVKYMAFMDKLNEPIPLTYHSEKIGEITLGYLHYGDKKTINKTIRWNKWKSILEPSTSSKCNKDSAEEFATERIMIGARNIFDGYPQLISEKNCEYHFLFYFVYRDGSPMFTDITVKKINGSWQVDNVKAQSAY